MTQQNPSGNRLVEFGIGEHHAESEHDIMNHIDPIDAKMKDQERAREMALATGRREDLNFAALFGFRSGWSD